MPHMYQTDECRSLQTFFPPSHSLKQSMWPRDSILYYFTVILLISLEMIVSILHHLKHLQHSANIPLNCTEAHCGTFIFHSYSQIWCTLPTSNSERRTVKLR